MYETILWATDGSDGADVAFEEALGLAEATGARLLAVHVDQRILGRSAGGLPVLVDEPEIRRKVEGQVERARRAGVEAELLVKSTRREPSTLVAAIALEDGADVIVCGTRGLRALSSAFVGSFAQRLLHIAPCPVLVVGPRSEAHAAVEEDAPRATA